MSYIKRYVSLLLAAVILGSLLTPAALAAEPDAQRAGAAGTLAVTLRFDYAQRLEEVEGRGITLSLSDSTGQRIGSYDLSAGTQTGFQSMNVQYTVRNRDGGVLTTEPEIGYYDLSVSGLAQGRYTLSLRGEGYRSFEDQVELSDFSCHVVVGTSDATFTLGDVIGDGAVTETDRQAVETALGQTDPASLSAYDLNGDGSIDIIDLAYVNHNIGASGGMERYSTTPIAPETLLNLPALTDEVRLTGLDGTSIAPGQLFQGGSVVRVAPSSAEAPLRLPLELKSTVELQQVILTSPDGAGAVVSGTAEILYIDPDDGQEKTKLAVFDNSRPADVELLSEGSTTVTIQLGRRVPVKKITITVTKVEGQDGTPTYAAVESIQFLQDIVPENPIAPNSQVKHILAQPGSEQVTLKWTGLPNVSGYVVRYGEQPGSYDKSLSVEVPTAVVDGLENLTTYYFTVTPVSNGWEGRVSDEISATPQPAARPDTPDFVSLKALDGALTLSWGKSKNATSYSVYYRAAGAANYTRAVSNLAALQYTIPSLSNGVSYELYVTASNTLGESAPSKTVEGTPKAVIYQEPAGIPTANRIAPSHITGVSLTDAGNVDQGQYPNGGCDIRGVMDGDYATHWTSQSYGHGNWARNKEINFTFDQPVTMSYVVWVPRLDGDYRSNLRLYTITVTDSEGNQRVVAKDRPVHGSPQTTGFAVLPFEPTSDIQTISIKIEQRAYSAVSLSEIIFFQYDPENDLGRMIEDLFTDGSMTALRDTVTAETIETLKAKAAAPDAADYYFSIDSLRDELVLAESLLPGHTPALGAVVDGVQSRSGNAPGNQGQGGSLLQPIGAVAGAGKEISVYASIPEGEKVSLVATQFNAEASEWQKTVTQLTDGRNVVTIPQIGSQTTPRGGSLYITYEGGRAEEIKLQVRRATDIPMLELSDLDLTADRAQAETRIAAYLEELQAYLNSAGFTSPQTHYLNSTELSMSHVLLSIPADSVGKNVILSGSDRAEQVRRLYENALAWEQVMEIACTTQGIDDNSAMETRQNIRYMQMFAGAFMYAAGSHVGIGYGSCGGMVCGSPVSSMGGNSGRNRLFGWGIAHEIGHNMDKLGKAEITNNIYSLMVQTYDGGANVLPSRLETSGKYQEIFAKTAAGYPGASNNVFVQLGMYWQLHLAYDDGARPLDFYNRFFKSWKAGDHSGLPYDDRVAVIASETAGYDLSEFFTRWGMRPGSQALSLMSALPGEDRAVWYLSDESRRCRLDGQGAGTGEITNASARTTGREDGVYQVRLSYSCTADPEDVQVYEITRNQADGSSKTVGCTAETSYTDGIGSANNQTFWYTVRAYDKLGNLIDTANTNEVRVAYDATVDPSAYTLEWEPDGVVTARFQNDPVTVISGIKVTPNGEPLDGPFTVEVRGPNSGDPFVLAKSGDFSAGDGPENAGYFLSYFNKPGASGTDTRIWAYDAGEVRISGLPDDAAVEFISYAGDHIAFQDEAVMGLLSEDYTYDTMDGRETIPAGTLVIVGSYRGDPLFNYLNLNGQYVTTEIDGETGEQTVTTREIPVEGEVLMFAEVPEDGAVSDISDGLFLFVPKVQPGSGGEGGPLAQDQDPGCTGSFGLPARIQARLYRTDDPTSTDGRRLTSSTFWVDVPSLDSLPEIRLNGMEVEG